MTASVLKKEKERTQLMAQDTGGETQEQNEVETDCTEDEVIQDPWEVLWNFSRKMKPYYRGTLRPSSPKLLCLQLKFNKPLLWLVVFLPKEQDRISLLSGLQKFCHIP